LPAAGRAESKTPRGDSGFCRGKLMRRIDCYCRNAGWQKLVKIEHSMVRCPKTGTRGRRCTVSGQLFPLPQARRHLTHITGVKTGCLPHTRQPFGWLLRKSSWAFQPKYLPYLPYIPGQTSGVLVCMAAVGEDQASPEQTNFRRVVSNIVQSWVPEQWHGLPGGCCLLLPARKGVRP